MRSNQLSNCGFLFNYLRLMIFNFDSSRIERWQRTMIVEQILQASPNLSDLTVGWKDFVHCSRSYFQLQRIHLVLNQRCAEASRHINIDRLAALVPNLCYLKTSRGYMIFNENLVDFILNMIRRFNRLLKLGLNKGSPSRCKTPQKLIFQETLTKAINKYFSDCNTVRIQVVTSDYLFIWL